MTRTQRERGRDARRDGEIARKGKKPMRQFIKNRNGEPERSKDEVRSRWSEHSYEFMNFLYDMKTNLSSLGTEGMKCQRREVYTIIEEEKLKVLKSPNSGKYAGLDEITFQIIKMIS